MDKVKFALAFEILVLLSSFMATKIICNGNSLHPLCIEIEQDALLKFKKELEDPSNRLASWVAGTNCCKWVAIRCDNLTGHVKEINLANTRYVEWGTQEEMISFENYKLKGNLSNSILNLKNISRMDLSYNDFGGIHIPHFLGSLVSLKHLNLTSSGFEGLIPHQLGNLSNLQHLGLRGNSPLFGQPKFLYSENLQWLQGLHSISSLDLSQVNLSKVSNWLLEINKLPSLVELYLHDCELNHITLLGPVNFTSLSVFDVSSNNFNTFIPKWILNLGSLISIDLSQSNFQGSLPKGFSNLTSLERLNLEYNYLNSSLPEWLFSLSKISYLDLSINDFEGPIPYAFQNLTALTHLDLSFNYFNSTLPSCLYSFGNLQYLSLSHLYLPGEISNDIGNLTNLVYINLSSNKLEGCTPKSIGTLCNLKTIYLGRNKFNGRLSEFFDSFSGCLMESMVYLNLARNNISGHFTNLAKLRNLKYLILSGNFISGPIIPEVIGNLSSLEYLDLSQNELDGTLPKNIGSLSSLQTLRISSNRMEGIVSEVHFTSLVNVKILDMSENNLTFIFFDGWIPPFNLSKVYLSSCKLGPQFPKWLKSQKNLNVIDLSNVGISDSIPDWFWRMSTTSYYLNLSHNQLSGRIPNFLLDIEYIYLGSNKFHGSLPRISSNVLELDLSNNSFSGSLDHFLCNVTTKNNQLKILHLGDNHLSGSIPDCWSKWMSLQIVKLGNNNFSGKLPSSLGTLSKLWSFHVRNNNLVGEISQSLQNCLALRILDLSSNAFHGSIPAWIGTNLSGLMILGLRSNQLSGSIPNELCYLSNLQIIDIGSNNLIGYIPSCFGNFTAMTTFLRFPGRTSYLLGANFDEAFEKAYITTKGKEFEYANILGLMTSMDLSNNNLFGEVPEEITNLFGLRSLNLSRNDLRGNIPEEIGRMRNMESLDFSSNRLSGKIPQSMTSLTFLSYLNFSYNNLSGQIPSSTQFQRFDPSSFFGNELCGPPLTNSCQMEGMTPKTEIEEEAKEGDGENYIDEWFFLSIAIGFIVGFWGIWSPLLISQTWRHAYFRRLSSIFHRLNQ